MKAKTLWLLLGAGILLIGCGKEAEQARQHAEKELQAAQAELAEARTAQANLQGEVDRLRKDNQELLRLRNEVRQVRDEKLLLQKQVQTAQSALVGAQAENQRVQAQAQAVAQAQAQALARPQPPGGDLANACINNLRQIDAAKQQWALEQQKTAEAIPTVQDLAPYFKDGIMPVCPATGKYTLNAMNAAPACSIPGHALPQQ
jgi:hypothetical protein